MVAGSDARFLTASHLSVSVLDHVTATCAGSFGEDAHNLSIKHSVCGLDVNGSCDADDGLHDGNESDYGS